MQETLANGCQGGNLLLLPSSSIWYATYLYAYRGDRPIGPNVCLPYRRHEYCLGHTFTAWFSPLVLAHMNLLDIKGMLSL